MSAYLPFRQMQNVECKMQNECISFGNSFKSCRRHTTIMHYAFFILHWAIHDGPLNDDLPAGLPQKLGNGDGQYRSQDHTAKAPEPVAGIEGGKGHQRVQTHVVAQ